MYKTSNKINILKRNIIILRAETENKVIVIFKMLFILCIGAPCSCLQTHHKRGSDPFTDGYKLLCRFWELN